MCMSREELEQALLGDPFNTAIRLDYAALLLAASDAAAALQQYELSTRQQADAPALVGMARALLALDRRNDALSAYARARQQSGFVADPALDQLSQTARHGGAPALSLIAGTDKVVPLKPQAERTVRFEDVGGMAALKKSLRLHIIEPFLRPSLFARFKKDGGGGILLYGPPGCGKTMIARAIASECNASFLSVGISDVLNMWMGESERNLAQLFEKARAQKPCVLFFDELDALAFSRSKAQSEHSRTIVNEFLAQLDGFERNNRDVLFLGATNMPWDVDAAMKRPGRFSRQIFVPPPDLEARRHIIDIKLREVPTEGIDAEALAKATEQFSGADIDGLIDLAKESAIHDIIAGHPERPINAADFTFALDECQPSTIEWLKTARNLVRYAGSDASYRDVEKYLKQAKLL
ncbi:ATP-binding protein [Pseudoduganella namucuonensis]|uniref:ATPase family associated with various cellular activities (AAA) n=1 Tax=Pseudoduganella namucuonensis TaxID=1035707 RepID=A0A1I7FFK0_9BURK|nr:ATP-binding protein [Pseudoduganella namucuonensis]SFU34970.1 ATPase family associated with various cellular activities (AAA) [Pseudoduganella namucuonensis]